MSCINVKLRRGKKPPKIKNQNGKGAPTCKRFHGSVPFYLGTNLHIFLLTAITCGHPGNPAHGMTNGSEFNLNDVVNFTCNTGYLLQGASRAQCRSNGQWSSPLPNCRGKSLTLLQNTQKNSQTCVLGTSFHLYLSFCISILEIVVTAECWGSWDFSIFCLSYQTVITSI